MCEEHFLEVEVYIFLTIKGSILQPNEMCYERPKIHLREIVFITVKFLKHRLLLSNQTYPF